MFRENFKSSPIKLAVLLSACFVLLVIFIVVCFNPRESFKKPPQDNNHSVESDNIILSWLSSADAKEYILQVDDNSNFNSPTVEKRVSGRKTNLVVNLPKESKAYYWRIKTVNENNIESEWQGQGDLKKSLPEEDFAILMDGEYYHIGEYVNFYLFIRNNGKIEKTFPYEISIESKAPWVASVDRETHDTLKGIVAVEPNSYKLEKVEMKATDALKIDRVIYAVAESGGLKAIETFHIAPSYKIKIDVDKMNKGENGKVKLSVANESESAIKKFEVKLSLFDNLRVNDSALKSLSNLSSGKSEVMEWNVIAGDPGYCLLTFDISSDGGSGTITHPIEIGHGMALLIKLSDIKIPLNQPSKLKVKVANLSDSSVTANLEIDHKYNTWDGKEYAYPIKIKEKNKIIALGPTSEKCVRNFSEECSAEVEWEVTGTEYGNFDYFIKAGGFEIIKKEMGDAGHGYITVTEEGHKLNVTIDGNDKQSEKTVSGRGKEIEFEIKIENLSDLPDSVVIYVFPDGAGWYVKLYDGEELTMVANYTVDISPNSSHILRLVTAPYETRNITNPLNVNVQISSKKDKDINEFVFAKAIFKE